MEANELEHQSEKIKKGQAPEVNKEFIACQKAHEVQITVIVAPTR